jgi:Protein of unknown function (DUF3108)
MVNAQTSSAFCGLTNKAFKPSEYLQFKIFYSAAGFIKIGAGEATFVTKAEKLGNQYTYHVIGEGSTYSFYDGIFKVRDKYESFMDTANLTSVKFVRNISEGGFKKLENVSFNRVNSTATSKEGTYKLPDCTQDVLSAVYSARNINFDSYKVGDKIAFTMFLDNQVHNMYLRYLGKEKIKTSYGKFRAIKFKPLLVKGTIFEGGEKMIVWVSDDNNHIPLRVESPIIVGSVKIDMIRYANLRHPLTSFFGIN